MGRIGGAARVLAAVAVLAATVAAPAVRAETTLTYSWPRNAGPLNPHLYSPNEMVAQAFVYEPLVRYRADGTLEPWLATGWTVSDDGLSYTFTLRDGVVFSDGTPFDAAAVKANVEAVLANAERHRWLALVDQIAGVEAVDPRTVRLTLKQPY